MKQATLDCLIEKYYEGKTSLQEEQQLRGFFQKEDLPESLLAAKEYFMATDLISIEELSVDFEQQLMDKIKHENNSSKWKINTYWFSGIAATVLLFLAIWLGPELIQPKEVYGTITDPEIAFAETKKVLGEVSEKMIKGMKPAKKTVEEVEKNVGQLGKIKKVNNAFKKTEKLNRLDEAGELLKSFTKVIILSGSS